MFTGCLWGSLFGLYQQKESANFKRKKRRFDNIDNSQNHKSV